MVKRDIPLVWNSTSAIFESLFNPIDSTIENTENLPGIINKQNPFTFKLYVLIQKHGKLLKSEYFWHSNFLIGRAVRSKTVT